LNPITEAWLRRNWPIVGALFVFAAFKLVHQFWFDPTAHRYTQAIKDATAVGMPLDPDNMPRIMPPRLFARIADNSLPDAKATEAASSGQLTAELLGDISQRFSHRGLVVTGSEPGPTTDTDRSLQLRAHVRARGRYPDFVLLLDDLALDTRLYGVERFSLTPQDESGVVDVELWVFRLVLKSGVKS